MAKIAFDPDSGHKYVTQWLPPVIAADGTVTTAPRIIVIIDEGAPVTAVILPATDVQTAKTPTGQSVAAQPDGQPCLVYDQGNSLSTMRSADWGATWA